MYWLNPTYRFLELLIASFSRTFPFHLDFLSQTHSFFFAANQYDELPRILKHPECISVNDGEQVTISCVTTTPPSKLYAVMWLKDGKELKETSRCKYRKESCSNNNSNNNNSSSSSSNSNGSNCNVIKSTYSISNACLEDQGNYVFKINTLTHSVTSNQGRLHAC